MKSHKILISVVVLVLLVSVVAVLSVSAVPLAKSPVPKFSTAVAFDKTPALRDMARSSAPRAAQSAASDEEPRDIRPERGPVAADRGFAGDGAIQGASASRAAAASLAATVSAPIANFEGISNQDNFNIFGFRVNPPDPVGDVGPNHYVEMVNLAFAVYNKQGNLLLGPVDTGTLWPFYSNGEIFGVKRFLVTNRGPKKRSFYRTVVNFPVLAENQGLSGSNKWF